ncbi:hypothetical protein [Wenxinia marina]|uniref:Membrane protein (DUF2238) n=1 Tax=Wenxinia marina DSM 24838 TaxID=1123501 RepID=A0A0D0PYL3_9RHOB|nr:hypothetical protein [Wenxinia marina]KIQ67524.1 hypothetical protein Wenmar_03949 [Wenxinia marina DSM 24838]GGL68822.1 hypothetical protein GCM10011392_24090 [Wenxinia marina]
MSPILLYAIRAVLLVEGVTAAFRMAWPQVFVALGTLVLTFLPERAARFLGVRLPPSFLALTALFIFATLFLGEVANFYERIWWWDMVLHFGSALSFGVLGFLMIFMLFEGDRYAAPPWAIGVLSFCVAVTIGAIWEIFEFAVDQTFGTNMQKSGLPDTMGDLIVDTLGGALGGLAGYLYLKGVRLGRASAFDAFIDANRKLYRRVRRR